MSMFYSGPNKKGAEEEEIALDIFKKFDRSHRYNSEIFNDHKKYLQKYMGVADPLPKHKKNTGASNIFVPLIEPHVDTVVAKAFLTLMGNDPFVTFVPEDQDSVLPAKVTERLFRHYFYDKMKNSLTNMWLWFRNVVLNGTGVVHLYHDKDTHFRTRTEVVPNPVDPSQPMKGDDGSPIEVEVTEEVTDFDGIRFEVVELCNFATDWDTTDWRKSWVILREFVDPEVYLTRVDTLGYKKLNEEELENLLEVPTGYNSATTSYSNKQYDVPTNEGIRGDDGTREKIELLHYYGKGYVDGVRQDVLYTVTKHKGKNTKSHVVLGPMPFGVKPFSVMRFKPNQDKFLGRGIGEQLDGLQNELNVTRNQRIDNIAMELNGGWILEDGAVEDETQLHSRMGQIIKKNPGTEISKIDRRPIPPDAFNHEEGIKMDAQNVSASNDLFRGHAERKETATVATMLNQNAGQRLEAIMMVAMEDGIQDFANIAKMMMVEFAPSSDEIVVKLTEDEVEKYRDVFATAGVGVDENGFMNVPVKKLLTAGMHASAKVSALNGDNRARSQELIQILQTLMTVAPQGWQKEDGSVETVDLSYFVKEFLRMNKYTDFKGIFQTLKTAEQAEQERQMAIAQQQAQIDSQNAAAQAKAPGQEVGGQAIQQTPEEAIAQQAGVQADLEDQAMAQQ